MKQSQKG